MITIMPRLIQQQPHNMSSIASEESNLPEVPLRNNNIPKITEIIPTRSGLFELFFFFVIGL